MKEVAFICLGRIRPLRNAASLCNTYSVEADLFSSDGVEGHEIGAVVDDRRPRTDTGRG